MIEQLDTIQSEAMAALEGVHDEAALRAWYAAHLAKKSPLMTALGDLGKLPKEQRAEIGKRGNEVKRALEAAYAEKEQAIQAEALARSLKENAVDVTLPGRRSQPGRLHITTQTLRHIYQVFGEMGFQVYRSARRGDATTTTLSCSTSRPTTRRATCGTRSARQAKACCCARTPRPARFAPCARCARSRCASSCPASATATSRSRRAPSTSSTRSRGWRWATASRWPT